MVRKVKRLSASEGGAPDQDAFDYIEFEQNDLLRDLCGTHDAHLLLIEKTLDMRIDMRGNRLVLSGGEGARVQAKSILSQLYSHLKRGHQLSESDVLAQLRLSEGQSEGKPKSKEDKRIISLQKRSISPRSTTQAAYLDALDQSELVFGVGPAGTGKTYLAVAYAAHLLLTGQVERIILSRPAIEAGERIGFLPGDMKEKVDPYLRPLYDALYDVMHTDFVDRRIASGDIEIAPLAFMRGRTLSRAAVILDEGQNATTAQMKMFLTRLGEHSRMIITGDPTQTDLPAGVKSGLVDALGLLSDLPDVRVVKFSSADVVRHHLVAKIVQAYDRRAKHMQRKISKGDED